MCAVKRSRSHLRCGQAVKQQKRWSKFFDPGHSCDYSAYGSDHPLRLNIHTCFSLVKGNSEGLLPECSIGVKELSPEWRWLRSQVEARMVTCVWFINYLNYRLRETNFAEAALHKGHTQTMLQRFSTLIWVWKLCTTDSSHKTLLLFMVRVLWHKPPQYDALFGSSHDAEASP